MSTFTIDELQDLIRGAVRKHGGGGPVYDAAEVLGKYAHHGSPIEARVLNSEPLQKWSLREQVRSMVRKAVVAALQKHGSQLESPLSEWEGVGQGKTPEPAPIVTQLGEFSPHGIEPVANLDDLVMAQIRGQVPTPKPREWSDPNHGFLERTDLHKFLNDRFERAFGSSEKNFDADGALPAGWCRCHWCSESVRDAKRGDHLNKCTMLATLHKIEQGDGLAKREHPARY
jgi:hypothetical protein